MSKKLTPAQLKDREYEASIAQVAKKLTWAKVLEITSKDMCDAVENLDVETIVMPTAKSTGKSRFVSIYIIYMLYHDKDFNAFAARKKKIDNISVLRTIQGAMTDIEEELNIKIKHHFEFVANNIMTKITFKRHRKQTIYDQCVYFGSFDQPDSLSGIAPQHGYYGVLWLEEPVQQRDTSGISHEDYMLSYATVVDSVNRFAMKYKKRFIIFATMNGWDDRHYFIKLAEDILPWEEFVDWASINFKTNNSMLKIRGSVAVIRATKYSNPIIIGDKRALKDIEENMDSEIGRARVLGQVIESGDGDLNPYRQPLKGYTDKEIFNFNEKGTRVLNIDSDFGFDGGTWAAAVMFHCILYVDMETKTYKLHFHDAYVCWNKFIVQVQKKDRIDPATIEDHAAHFLAKKKNWFTNSSAVMYDYADEAYIRNIKNLLERKYNVSGLSFSVITDKNKKGKFDVLTRQRWNIDALGKKNYTFSPKVWDMITKLQPLVNLITNGKDEIYDKKNATNYDDLLEALERAARPSQGYLGEPYEEE